ncbi:MAG: ABC transporter ATP-binding protein [Elusimicrobia bacterium]|nr:ABC transporter ATP-binding protein [Elusimicrobiota bacterium]MBK7207534.1 ABC transporter ATP-binding protein [Elusimicrobiota bacterium]MBK7544304.1 ABC transporter ATP-binding protein [Elusimicrobiota bacterium]MBK7573826.1 ABC transporter ATP-binding protein [Elusimicrobiota bacterium]MBK7689424.1 ABC transporter ATP-binding protein [Elusimicrobiota bacterium]
MLSIRVDDLRKTIAGRPALDGLSAAFAPGTLHGLIGPDGAGKTTFLRLLAGLLRPSAGRIDYLRDGRPVPFDDVRPRLAYMPQTQSLYADLSVGEHLEFFRDLHAVPEGSYRPRRDRLLALTRLAPFVDRPAGQLSGGMYKKLGLMCALIASPEVLLLDEPTNGVDPVSRRDFWNLLYELRDGGLLVLIATAYMDEAERCDRVGVLDAGRWIANGPPRELLEDAGVPGFAELFIRRGSR